MTTARSSRPIRSTRALAQKWMDWQLSVMGPAITPVFWGLIRTPPEKRDANAIAAGKAKTIEAAKMMDAQLGKTKYLAGDEFSYGDIPVGIMIYRYVQLIPGAAVDARTSTAGTRRSQSRPAFKEHVAAVPLT